MERRSIDYCRVVFVNVRPLAVSLFVTGWSIPSSYLLSPCVTDWTGWHSEDDDSGDDAQTVLYFCLGEGV